MRNAGLIGAGSTSFWGGRWVKEEEEGSGMMERAARQLGVGLKGQRFTVGGGGGEIDGDECAAEWDFLEVMKALGAGEGAQGGVFVLVEEV